MCDIVQIMKKNIAILRGGNTKEIHISIKSADVVFQSIDQDKYTPYLIHIENQDWNLIDGQKKWPIQRDDFSCIIDQKKITFDGVFMAIHGTPGEDGTLQAYFDLIRIPYNCSGTFESSITFNKAMCNALLKQFNIRSGKSIILQDKTDFSPDEIERKIGFPCFVKPNRAGSSLGISKVLRPDLWFEALEKAFEYDQQVIAESYIKGIEVSCGIIEKKGELIVLPLTEIYSENEFFDYDAKYLGKSQEITPARIEKQESDQIESISKDIYKILQLKGIVRMDFIIKDKKAYLIEVNTVPGFTKESILPQQALTFGLSLKELFGLSIENMLSHD